MKVLVTGAGGFIGGALLELLAEGGGRPVSAVAAVDMRLQATAWWMSALRWAKDLVHAAAVNRGRDSRRAWPLQVLRLSIGEMLQTLSRVHGVDGERLVRYAPLPALEAVFAAIRTSMRARNARWGCRTTTAPRRWCGVRSGDGGSSFL